MSAPDTNIERQESNHKPSLLGIKGAMMFGGLMLLAIMFFAVSNGTSPTEGETYTDAERQAASQESSFDTYAPGTNESN